MRRRWRASPFPPSSVRSRGRPRSGPAPGTARCRPRRRARPPRAAPPARAGGAVPAGPVLFLQRHQAPVRRATLCPAAVIEQHEGEQGAGLRLRGQQAAHQPSQSNCLVAQLVPHREGTRGREVALAEHQVDARQHARKPFGQQLRRRYPQRDRGPADLRLRTAQPLRHGVFGLQEGTGDLGRAQTAHQAQGQGDPRFGRQGGVAAGEDHPQLIVRDR